MLESEANAGFFKKLLNGEFGLAKTFWLFWLLVGIVWGVVLAIVEGVFPLPLLWLYTVSYLVYLVYQVLVMIGLWRAANKYKGWKVWAVLAQIVAVLIGISVVLTIVVMMVGFIWI